MLPSDLNLLEMILNAGIMVKLVLLLLLLFSVSSWRPYRSTRTLSPR
jgi:hypothetical protein